MKFSHAVNKLYYNGTLNTFAFEYTDQNRAKLLSVYKTAGNFISKFKIGDNEVKALKDYLILKKANGINFSGNETGFSQILKALIGRNLFDRDAYYPILYENDTAILRAIEVLK